MHKNQEDSSDIDKVGKIILAPMEGVIDAHMRHILTSINLFNFCVTEFVRVVDQKVPKHIFYKLAPELRHGGYTPSQTPIRLQLLGQEPNWMAENAVIATELGSHGIDINFGCPAPTVNKRKGGAALLQFPELIYAIVSQVKTALNTYKQPLSVKIRLGFNDQSLFNEIISAIDSANPDLLTIHARTKKQGYKPPAYWNYIGDSKLLTNIETVANGEIWQKDDAINCMRQAQTNNIMLGRGILATPNLAQVISNNHNPFNWQQICKLMLKWQGLLPDDIKTFYFSSRLKQWLRYLKLQHAEASQLFEQIKRLESEKEIRKVIQSHCQ